HGDAFGDADRQIQVGLHRFPDRSRGACGRHVDHADGGARVRLRVLDAGVDGDAFEVFAGLLRVDAGDEAVLAVRVVAAAARVELAGLAGDALGDDLGVFVVEDGHGVFLGLAGAYFFSAAITAWAASAIVSALM